MSAIMGISTKQLEQIKGLIFSFVYFAIKRYAATAKITNWISLKCLISTQMNFRDTKQKLINSK